MQIIDSEGRLFGYVNVIDALVLLFVLAVLVAGVALVTGSGGQSNQAEAATENVTVQVGANVSEPVAGHVNVGDQYTVGQRTVAEVESVAAYPIAGSSKQRLVTSLTLRTSVTDGQRQFLGNPVRIDSTVPFENASYRFNGTVLSVTDSRPGTPVDATLQVEWENVRPAVADAVSPGMSEQHRGADATITNIERSPATVVLRTEGGEIFAREHPVNEDVSLTVSVAARQTNGTLSFHGRPVQTGDTIVLDFGTVTVDGTVTGISVDD